MEQKTEASQAVDDQAVSVEVYSNAVWLTKGMQVFRLAYTGESDADRNWYAGQLRAALKAQPAPTEATKGPLEIPEPGNSNSLADRIFRLPCNWKGDRNLSAAIEMGHAMACEQAYDLAYEHAAQASTEAAQGAQPSGNPGELVQGWDVDDLINDMDINEEVAGMRAELQANSTIIPSILAAQGEDSARLECAHANGRTARWDWITCDDCGAIYTGSGEREWGVAQNMWFKSVSEAKFYKENGRYPDRARASAETGGVKS